MFDVESPAFWQTSLDEGIVILCILETGSEDRYITIVENTVFKIWYCTYITRMSKT
jgi:hypothetical protein